MLCTLLAPTGGRALVAGHDIAAEPGRVRLRIGAALQDAALDPKQDHPRRAAIPCPPRFGRPDSADAHITRTCIHGGHHFALRHPMITETFFLT